MLFGMLSVENMFSIYVILDLQCIYWDVVPSQLKEHWTWEINLWGSLTIFEELHGYSSL